MTTVRSSVETETEDRIIYMYIKLVYIIQEMAQVIKGFTEDRTRMRRNYYNNFKIIILKAVVWYDMMKKEFGGERKIPNFEVKEFKKNAHSFFFLLVKYNLY